MEEDEGDFARVIDCSSGGEAAAPAHSTQLLFCLITIAEEGVKKKCIDSPAGHVLGGENTCFDSLIRV